MKDTVYVPPIKIQGIKTKLVPLIKQSVDIDKNSVWIEPFMGSGVVGFNVEPHYAIFADTNPHSAHTYCTFVFTAIFYSFRVFVLVL